MSITVTELVSSREIDGDKATADFNSTRKYSAEGSSDETSVYAEILAAAPATITVEGVVLGRESISLNPEFVDTSNSTGLWFADVKYRTLPALELTRAPLDAPIPKDKIPELRFSGSVANRTVTRSYSLQTVAQFGADAEDFEGAIEVDESGINGVEIFTGAPTWTVRKRYTQAQFEANYIDWLRYAKPSHVNNATYRGFAAGELLYLGADFQDDFEYDPESETLTVFYEVTFTFAVSFNGVPDISSGSLPPGTTLTSKQGWDYLWIARERPDPENDPTNVKPVGVYYERVYPRANFVSNIGLP